MIFVVVWVLGAISGYGIGYWEGARRGSEMIKLQDDFMDEQFPTLAQKWRNRKAEAEKN